MMNRDKKEESIAVSDLEKLFNTVPSMAACCYAKNKLKWAGPIEGYWTTYRSEENGAFSTSPQLMQTAGSAPTSYNVSVPVYSMRTLLDLYYEKSAQEENPETVHQLLADAVTRYITDYLSEDSGICDVNCYGDTYVTQRQTAISFELCKRLTDYVGCGTTEFVWTYTEVGDAIPKRVPRSSVSPANTTAIEPIRMIDAYTIDELYRHHMLPFDWELETTTRHTNTGEQYQFVISKPRYKDQVQQVSYRSRWFPAYVCADGFAAFFMDIQKL